VRAIASNAVKAQWRDAMSPTHGASIVSRAP
jgi:hypothetical protein